MYVGYVIESLRMKNNFTHSELAKRIFCTREEIIKIERSDIRPSADELDKMSDVFKFDILSVIDTYDNFSCDAAYKGFIDIHLAVYHFDLTKMKELVEILKYVDDFKSGELLQLILHIKSFVAMYLDKDKNKTMELCREALMVFYELDYDVLRTKRLTDVSYSILVTLAAHYELQGDAKTCAEISELIILNMQKFVLTDVTSFMEHSYVLKKNYVISVNNIAQCNFELKNYSKALRWVEDGIDKCKRFQVLYVLPYLQHIKFECLYCLEKYEEAQINYDIFKTISIIANNGKVILFALDEINEKYPKLNG